MKKFGMKALVAVLVVVMAMSCFAGCGEKKSEGFLIGGSGPLTGDASSYGISVKQGAEVAIDEINAAGGINGFPVTFKMEDDQADGEKAANVCQQLVDDGMHAFMGSVTTGSSLESGEITKENNIFQITPSASAADCAKYDNQFRVCFTDPLQGKLSAEFIAKNFASVKKVGVLYDSSDAYSEGIFKAFKETATGLDLTIEKFTKDTNTDFSAQIESFKSAGCEFVFLPFYYTEAAAVITQAKEKGLDVPFLGCDGLDGVAKQANNNAVVEGVMYLTPFLATATDSATKTFVDTYNKKYNAIPDQFAADGYDAIYAIKTAMEKADLKPDADPSDICDAMKTAMTQITVAGLTGSTTWNAQGEPTKAAMIVTIKDGEPVPFAG